MTITITGHLLKARRKNKTTFTIITFVHLIKTFKIKTNEISKLQETNNKRNSIIESS